MNKGCVLMLLFSFVSLLSAEPRQDYAGEKLAGAWRLVSVVGTDATFHFAYDHPTGIITYDRSGWMAVQIDIKALASPSLTGPPPVLAKRRWLPSTITSRITAPTRWI